MPRHNIVSVERTKIVISGEVSEEVAREVFLKSVDDAPLIGMRRSYDPAKNETTICFLPGRIYSVKVDPLAVQRTGCTISHERRLLVPGVLPQDLDPVAEIWMPIRKRAKHTDSNLRWVVMYEPQCSVDNELKAIFTELRFTIEGFSIEDDGSPRGCKNELVASTLDKAAEAVAEKLREIIEGSAGDALVATHFIDEASMNFCECIAAL